ncbi:AAA family ATPase [Burkholderia multivorans]|uniref:AAA family ATPase n=1 Tax=Burkholderia multivorans TaxID=87883 RepID=UPI002019C072|nr:AAA family ATPase [Burkholderia multivorans]MCO1371141.1 AAA family ATPase [Burkholderia multivorans]MCO1457605.1 AAA family ATPase [Burkholderia multivorans]MCO1466594.1 AAA family ATPase [Burkholderia multivorans]UQO15731.1 AAA family ATPase [Burkholderia multivorans]UQO86906.1 AAA family ATPase [Burkholderia multivorans]
MTAETPGFRLRFLGFFGPQKQPSTVTFGPGLNVIYGASNTGKSFIVEVIDFMLGGKPPLRDIPERVGYDLILLGIETLDGKSFTLWRSMDGGGFRLYENLHEAPPATDIPYKQLDEKHSERNDANLFSFLLILCGLGGKRVRRNSRNETNSLSFRNIARLMIVNETEITQQSSPLFDGNPTANTPNLATFKLLLTGTDDSALVASNKSEPEELSREAQLHLLDQLLDDYRDRLKELTKSPKELEEQLEKIDTSLRQQAAQVNTTEAEFQEAAGKRRELRKKLEESRERRAEVGAMLERFSLLDRHYVSDIERLRAIEEGGTLFNVLGSGNCPLCGAAPAAHRTDAECNGDIDAVVHAARKEISKIEVLRAELAATVQSLERESVSFDRRMPAVVRELNSISGAVEELIAPRLSSLRKSYSDFADKRAEVREALAIYATVQDMERRRADLEKGADDEKAGALANADIPTTVTHSFAKTVEGILTGWHFPEAGDVYFDSKTRDLVIAGKSRSAFGKGLRAITHAAFTLGLLAFCRARQTPHTGFVVLDSPLLAYREPDGTEDDLTGTDLQEQFYAYLEAVPVDTQVIVVENTDPPDAIMNREQSLMFGKNPHHGRYGLFPFIANPDSA